MNWDASDTRGATGDFSTALGFKTISSGLGSFAAGNQTKGNSYLSFSTGLNNIGGGDPLNWVETDPLFEIGNGISTPSNALTILKNGTITAPSLTSTLIETAGAKALITKEYADANASTGLEAIDEGNGIGWRLTGRDPLYYGNIGEFAVDLSHHMGSSTTYGATGNNSTAMGNYTIALANGSTALGQATTASGNISTAMGLGTTASGEFSTAMGSSTTASGENSTSMGFFTTASGENSTAMGFFTTALAYSSTALGRNNIGSGNPNIWVDTDPLFEIGNSVSTIPSNALTVLKNGDLILPSYAGTGAVNLSVDSNGKLIKAPRNNQKFGQYEYYDNDVSNSGYTIARKSVAFEDNTTVKGISALLLDNNSGTGGVTNTNFVSLRRTARSITGSSEEMYRITGNNTAPGNYNNQISTSLLISGANVIDNANYLYFLQIYYCTSCDFREVVILE